jgi:hypothetical protein
MFLRDLPSGYQFALHWKNVERRNCMSNLKDKANDKVDEAAEAIKKTTGKVIDKSKDLAHSAGKSIEKGGKKLQDV